MPSRRAVMLGGLSAAAAIPLSRSAAAEQVIAGLRIVSMDFGLAETLIEMGLPPVALPDPASWAQWVVEPALPPGIVNLGTDREPNLEILAALKPDLIVTTPYLDAIAPLLARFASTRTFSVYAPPVGHAFDRSVVATNQLAAALGREGAGEALIARAQACMDEARLHLAAAGLAGRPVLAVNFLDARHVRVYGAGSLFGDVLERVGLVNGWTQPSNYWGFSTVGIEALAASPASRLVYLEPIAADTLGRLEASPLWRSLPFVQAGRVIRLPAVLMFGMLPSAMRFARQLTLHLAGERDDG
ncbi:iron complex transport system substrate-binding protein [Angulomicrobium amanitiforme]|uniref:Iron complex transport system substrate-binding protein n=2 Tax=Ancylobacter amanitiformis TaxID=217069 RepID=A0ABU0LKA4_9HYPH|nr:iron complex transport system substrate-binding protein [Ancylobacter amanitiformis]